MSRYGVIYCCYGNPEYVDHCLSPWLEAKKQHDILVAAVHGQFKEYHDLGIKDQDDATQLSLYNYFYQNKLDFLYIQNPYDSEEKSIFQTEAEIRDKGLQWLLKQNCDYIWLLDNDEFYTLEQINKIIKFVSNDEFIGWYSINFKNYIFDGHQWISGFCPPRIFKTRLGASNLTKCYWDNDFLYLNGLNQEINYKNMPHMTIPTRLAHIKHLTWLHSNGRLKYEYQMKHFGHCGYKWNYDTNKLEIDKEFHVKNKLPLPEIFTDENI